MWRIGIIDADDGGFIETARARFGASAQFDSCGESGDGFDAVVITAAAPHTARAACSIVVLPGTSRGVLADSAITFGLSPRDTVTVSSVAKKRITVSLQRDVVALCGRKVVRQEFDFPWITNNPESIEAEALPLAALGLLL